MKLASLSGGTSAGSLAHRGGRLVVVSNDLAWCADAGHIVPTLQGALDDWQALAPVLEALHVELEHEAIPRERFHEREALAPLPRAYLWMNAGGDDQALLHRAGDCLRGARTPAAPGSMAAGLCVVTDDVPQGTSAQDALGLIRLVGLAGDAAASGVLPGDATAFSPVFVTPDTLGAAWQGGRLGHDLHVELNGQPVSASQAADFGVLIARAAQARSLGAGSIIGSGAAAQLDLRAGDVVRIEVRDAKGHSIFGAIEQAVS